MQRDRTGGGVFQEQSAAGAVQGNVVVAVPLAAGLGRRGLVPELDADGNWDDGLCHVDERWISVGRYDGVERLSSG